MSILKQMRNLFKLDSHVIVEFPVESPEFKLKFHHFTPAELGFIAEESMLRGSANGKVDQTKTAILFGRLFLEKLKEKLVGWECEALEFTKENKKVFFDSLDYAKKQELIELYNEAVEGIKKNT